MNWFKKSLIFVFCIHSASTQLLAFSGTEGASFLEVPVGAKPAAMGGAYTAQASDLYASVYNPAGLAYLESPQVGGMHLLYLLDTRYEHLGGAFPLANHTAGVGFSIQYFRPGDLVGKDEFDVSTGDIGGSFGSYAASFGMRLTDRWSFGVTGKWIQAKIDDVSATTYAADAGTLLKLHDTLTFGAAVTNLGKKLTFIREGDSLPTAYRVGATWRPFKSYQFSLDGIHRLSGLNSVHTGVELFAGDLFSARFGYSTERTRQLSAMAGFSAGMGLHIWGQQFDYAFVPVSELGQTHYFSAIFKWGVPQKTIEEEKESSLLEPGHSTDESMDPLLKQGGRGENHSASDLMKENNDVRQELIEGSDASSSNTNELIDKNETLKREMIDEHE